jgi:hypothetical protein
MNENRALEVLRQARQCVKSYEYAAALEKYIWFHLHALDIDRGLVGVRLSYAISEWIALGQVYPPAKSALESLRDTKAESLAQGTDDVSLFHDVAAINLALGQVERTRDIFRAIAGVDRAVAEKYFHVALESLVETKDFDLARSFLFDPRKHIDQFVIQLNLAPQYTGRSPEIIREFLERIYVKNVRLILTVFVGVGEDSVANELRLYAVERIPDAQLQGKVAQRLYSSPLSTGIQ